MANDIFVWEAANIFLGDDDPGATNHLTLLSVQLPVFAQTMISYSPGGAVVAMQFPTTMLMEQNISFKLAGSDPDRLTKIGLGTSARQNFTVYGSVRAKRDNKLIQFRAVAHGVITSIGRSEFSRGSGTDLDFQISSIDRYKEYHDNREIYVLDFWESEFRVNGVSQTAEQNRALAIPGVA